MRAEPTAGVGCASGGLAVDAARLGCGALVMLSLSCAVVAPSKTPSPSLPPSAVEFMPLEVATPRSPQDAGRLFAELEHQRRDGDRAGVVARARALLRTDFLSDPGRANLYWLIAENSRGHDDSMHVDALGGFLVAGAELSAEPAFVERLAQARAWLIAAKIQASLLGHAPDKAIHLDSQEDADRVVAALSCGARGSPYVEDRRPGAFHGDGPEPRRLLCTETGESLIIWLRVDAPTTTNGADR
jgi:hypothetical protein